MLSACSADRDWHAPQSPEPDQPAATIAAPDSQAGLAGITALDSIKGATEIRYGEITVTTPVIQRHTSASGEFLEFAPAGSQPAYAVYRIEPPAGLLLSVDGTGDGPLWLMVADYLKGGWISVPFEAGAAAIDLTQVGRAVSPEGFVYAAVVCPPDDTGTLYTLQLTFDDMVSWGLEIATDEDSITLTWSELDCHGYEIYRSILPDDPFPNFVGYLNEAHTGGNTFTEVVPEDSLGRWVPENNEGGIPGNTTDDFPTVAPAVDYYYRIKAVLAEGEGPESPEVTGKIPWGDRSTTIRTLPDSTNQTRLFGCRLEIDSITAAQLEWVANNMAGCTGLTQSQIDTIRAINPEFVAVGSRLGLKSGSTVQTFSTAYTPSEGDVRYPLVYGEELDFDGHFPYIARHEDWFLHDESSEHFNDRVIYELGLGHLLWWMDADSPWTDYLGPNLLQLSGEDAFDGWVIENCTTSVSMDPSPFESTWHNIEYFEYLSGFNNTLLTSLSTSFAPHPKQPMLIADAWRGYYNSSENEPLFFDFSACDTVLYGGFLYGSGSDQDDKGVIWEFTNILGDEILRHQAAGRNVIMHHNAKSYTPGKMQTAYGCYLLVRGPASYYYSSPWLSSSPLQWRSEYSWETGAPLDPMPANLDELRVQSEDWEGNPFSSNYYDYYRRDFENGTLLVVPNSMYDKLDEPTQYEILQFNGGGDVRDDGSTFGSAEWVHYTQDPMPWLQFDYPGCYVIRVAEEQ